jgi:hypothetical protein
MLNCNFAAALACAALVTLSTSPGQASGLLEHYWELQAMHDQYARLGLDTSSIARAMRQMLPALEEERRNDEETARITGTTPWRAHNLNDEFRSWSRTLPR